MIFSTGNSMFRVSLVLLGLLTCSIGQSATISGLVMDGSAGVPLHGAIVTLGESGPRAETNAEGRYHLNGEGDSKLITFSKAGYDSVSRKLDSGSDAGNVVLTLKDKVTYVCTTADSAGRWQIARTVFDPATKTSEITYLTRTTQWNFKPNFSPDGSKVTFFRRYAANGPCCESWRSSVCVMNPDGSDLHEIIVGEENFNTEPYWSRDGSMRVTFNRMYVANRGPYWNTFDGQPGKESKILPSGWVNPHLADGRVFVQRQGNSFLATPNKGGKGNYVQVRRPDNRFIHKIALSQDESMIAYQKWVDSKHNMYKGGVMVYAKFDASVPSITNEVIFDELDPSTQAWYVSISTDNRFLLFAKDGAIMQHDVETGTTMKVSADSDPYKAYPTYTTFSK